MKNLLLDLIPKSSLQLVKYSGSELVNRLGKDIISRVVLSVLCGDNIRNLTEGLTQRRTLLMNASLFITYLKALKSFDNFSEQLTSIIKSELKRKELNSNEKSYLYWFLGLTGKSIQNVVRDNNAFEKYLFSMNKNLKEISNFIKKSYGELKLEVTNNNIKYLMQWPDLLRCMLAIGVQTLAIRGSEKSMYGKLFEKFILGSVLTLIGFKYIKRTNSNENNMVFWLSERGDKRESDATAILKPSFGVRFDIGFIGKGNTEISLDKVTRFEHYMEYGDQKLNLKTIILVDTIGERSRIERMAKDIGGNIIQMSGTYWVHTLVKVLHKEFPFYENQLLTMSQESSLAYLKKEISKVNLIKFLSSADVHEYEND